MNGRVDSGGRALLDVELLSTTDAAVRTITAWIDTGFTGDLVLPRTVIKDLDLPQSGTVSAILADGSQVALKTHTCLVKWSGRRQRLEVVAIRGGDQEATPETVREFIGKKACAEWPRRGPGM